MTVIIDIESQNLETRNKKGGGTYQVQEAFVHLTDQHGNPRRYPERINLFPPRDNAGNAIAYKMGQYMLSPSSFKVANGFLELGFPQLVPVEPPKAK
jgi:hypothetical protein